MKSNLFLGALLIAMAFTFGSCSSDSNENAPDVGEKTAQVQVTLKGTAVSRATGTQIPAQADENTVARYTLAIFNSSSKIVAMKEVAVSASASPYTTTLSCPAGSGYTGVVVANAPTKHFAGIQTKNDFFAKALTLTQTSTELPMSGEMKKSSSSSFDLAANATTSINVELSRLVARVSLNSLKTAFDATGQYANATFTVKGIFLHNAKTVSTPDTGIPTTTVLKTGWAATTSSDYLADLENTISNVLVTSTASLNPYWYYTFPNDNTKSTRLVIFGSFDPDGSGTAAASDVYYPIVVNLAQTDTSIDNGPKDGTIARNVTYSINATIKSIGVTSPNETIAPGTLSLSVTVADWALKTTQDVELN